MESVDDLHVYFERRDVSEDTLMKTAKHIETYSETLFERYDIQIGEDEKDTVDILLYKTLLHTCRNQSMQFDRKGEEILEDVIDDFESEESDRILGNMMLLIGKAGTIEETRHSKITKLGIELSEDESLRGMIGENPDFM